MAAEQGDTPQLFRLAYWRMYNTVEVPFARRSKPAQRTPDRLFRRFQHGWSAVEVQYIRVGSLQ